MSQVILKNPLRKRDKVIKLSIGDLVHIEEWDGISVRGIVKELTEETLIVHNAKFLSGCYEEFADYSRFKHKTNFEFELENLARIQVAEFETMTPISLLGAALADNYCGSEKIIMSSLFYQSFKRYLKDSSLNYCQYPIEIDQSMLGYCVYAIPNEDSIKHKKTPMKVYTIQFFKKGKYLASSIFSCFEDILEEKIQSVAKDVKKNTSNKKLAYRVETNGLVVKRGTV